MNKYYFQLTKFNEVFLEQLLYILHLFSELELSYPQKWTAFEIFTEKKLDNNNNHNFWLNVIYCYLMS